MSNNTENRGSGLTDFFFRNAWALILVTSSVVAQWAVFGARLDALEARVDANSVSIIALRDQGNQTALNIAQIQKDIEYMRLKIDRILP